MTKIKYVSLFFVMIVFSVSCKTSPKAKEALLNKPLTETCWELRSIEGQAVHYADNEKKTFIIFDEEGKYHGSMSCNRFFGTYYVQKKKMTLDYAGATKMLCQNMETENLFIKTLHKEFTHFIIQKDKLVLSYKGTELLIFQAVPKPEQPE